nr:MULTISPECIES: hypothetical protein [Citrobacter freundii complex]
MALVDSLEAELQRGELSEANRVWLAQCGLTPEQIQNQMEPEYTPQRTPLRPPGPAAGADKPGQRHQLACGV